jgi:spore maturation protein CgeB
VLARSRITVNTHASVAGLDANNLRLYEGTGMGALLLTEHHRNLQDLFRIGTEVVSYRNAKEAADLVGYYLEHEQEARQIAAAGQARTLSAHTWIDRMERVVRLVEARLRTSPST